MRSRGEVGDGERGRRERSDREGAIGRGTEAKRPSFLLLLSLGALAPSPPLLFSSSPIALSTCKGPTARIELGRLNLPLVTEVYDVFR